MYTFSKQERLTSRKLIATLFTSRKSFVVYPFRFLWCLAELPLSTFPLQICISVSKKKFKRANKRNLIKRHIREAFRHQKLTLYDNLNLNNKKILLGVVYISSSIQDTDKIKLHFNEAIERLINEINI